MQRGEQAFKETLELIPNGLLLVEMSTQEIVFSNSEMEKLVRTNKSLSLKDSVCNFVMHR